MLAMFEGINRLIEQPYESLSNIGGLNEILIPSIFSSSDSEVKFQPFTSYKGLCQKKVRSGLQVCFYKFFMCYDFFLLYVFHWHRKLTGWYPQCQLKTEDLVNNKKAFLTKVHFRTQCPVHLENKVFAAFISTCHNTRPSKASLLVVTRLKNTTR